MNLTNITGISLPLAVWLASDSYDFSAKGKSISATSLLKPLRQILLSERLTDETEETPDVSDFIASRLGHSIHDGIEQAWKHNYGKALKTLGYPDHIIDRIQVNPEKPEPGTIPVYLEQRASRKVKGYTISGKYDMILEGVLQDFKSTSVYSWIMGSKDEDYCLQGSIYRWINQDKVTADHMNIQFIFTDWSKAQSKQSNNYPQQRVLEHRVELMSLVETETWIMKKLSDLEDAADMDEADIPRCTDKDLWRGETVYKYFSNPAKTDGRATKNFKSAGEASAHKAAQGKGIIITIPGKVKACGYCRAFNACSQKDEYDHG